MKKLELLVVMVVLLAFPLAGLGQDSEIEPMLDTSPTNLQSEAVKSVTAVYGMGVDDYLPPKEVARQYLRPNVRSSKSRPAFDLPDAFFFIGGPVFLVIFVRILVIFLNGFEEKRQEEQRTAASEHAAGEHVVGD